MRLFASQEQAERCSERCQMKPITLDLFAFVDGNHVLSPDDRLKSQEVEYRAVFLSLDLDALVRYDPNALNYIYRQVCIR